MKASKNICGKVGPYRTIHLSKIIDPAIEKRRYKLSKEYFIEFILHFISVSPFKL